MPRQVDHDQRRGELSRAVWRLVGERGLDGLTLRSVAAAAGCTTGRVAHYFRDKNALLSHARDVMHRRMAARIDELPAQPDARARLRAVVQQGLPLDPDRALDATVWAHFLLAARTDPELRAQHTVRHESWVRRLTGLLGEVYAGEGRPAPSDLELRARSLAMGIDGLALHAVATPESYPAEVVTRLVDTQLEGVLP
ncbi:TetR/AcrR family transcriptional regulator [Actinomycetes bacterium KLBMP 9797]